LWNANWFLKFTSDWDTTEYLKHSIAGTFTFRFSRSNLGKFSCSIVEETENGKIVEKYLVEKSKDGAHYFSHNPDIKRYTLQLLYQDSTSKRGTKFSNSPKFSVQSVGSRQPDGKFNNNFDSSVTQYSNSECTLKSKNMINSINS